MSDNWKEICAKCKDGDIEPKHCEYYGEPNGCNSPTYGEHPPTLNMMAMYGALLKVKRLFDGRIMFQQAIREAHEAVNAALAEPPRNCDVLTLDAARKVWFAQEIVPRLNGDLPLGKEVPFEEWFVSQQKKGESK